MVTKLETFLRAHGLKPAHVAREAGCSRQHLLRVRFGRMEPTRPMIQRITRACAALSRLPVNAGDLFDIE